MFFDLASLPREHHGKLLSATITPRPIAWVVTIGPGGAVNAAPFSYFNAVSGQPPVVCLGIHSAPGHPSDTLTNLEASGDFTVCLVPHAMAQAMNLTAVKFPPEVSEVERAGLATAPSGRVKPPRLADSPVAFECRHLQTVRIGPEQFMPLGQVVGVHVRDDAVMDPARCYIDTLALDLLGRMGGGGGYTRPTAAAFEMARLDDAVVLGADGPGRKAPPSSQTLHPPGT